MPGRGEHSIFPTRGKPRFSIMRRSFSRMPGNRGHACRPYPRRTLPGRRTPRRDPSMPCSARKNTGRQRGPPRGAGRMPSSIFSGPDAKRRKALENPAYGGRRVHRIEHRGRLCGSRARGIRHRQPLVGQEGERSRGRPVRPVRHRIGHGGGGDPAPPPRRGSPYGAAKIAAELYLHFYRAQYGLDYTALRYANVYGPRQDPHGEAGVVAIFCERLLRGQTAIVNGDGEQTRDYVYVEDVVRANVTALERGGGHSLNIATGMETRGTTR